MKAWYCRNNNESCATIIFADTASKARYIAMQSDSIGDDLWFTEITVRRAKEMDRFYRGNKEMDWFNPEDRAAMVRLYGFECGEDYFVVDDCSECSAKKWCHTYERMNNYRCL